MIKWNPYPDVHPPKRKKSYIVTYRQPNGHVTVGGDTYHLEPEIKDYECNIVQEAGWQFERNVIAWAELPEPYKRMKEIEMVTRESTIKDAMASMNHLYGLMEEALEFNEAHVEAILKTVADIENACVKYRLSLYALKDMNIDIEDVLEYCEEHHEET